MRVTRPTAVLLALLLGAACDNPVGQGVDPAPTDPSAALACAPPAPLPTASHELPLAAASHLGGAALDGAQAVDVGPGCTLVVAGRFEGAAFAGAPTTGSGAGAVLRLDAAGRTVLSVTRMGDSIADMEVVRRDGTIAVAGAFGVARLRADGSGIVWQHPGAARRVAAAADGTVAALAGKTIRVFGADGTVRAERTLGNGFVEDVAVDAASGRVVVTGFDNKRLPDGLPVQVAYLYAYDLDLAPQWTAYGYPGSQLATDQADTRGYRVAIGRDGMLYFQGESAGGNTIFRWMPGALGTPAPNAKRDRFTDAFNTASNHITYFARLDPGSGTLLRGQLLLTRLSSGRGNTIRHGAITADEQGNVYVAGSSACCIERRDSLRIDGRPVGAYSGGDGYVLVVSPDFQTRHLWMVFHGSDGATSAVRGVAAAGGRAAVAGTVSRGAIMTAHPVQGSAGAGPGGFFALWAGRQP